MLSCTSLANAGSLGRMDAFEPVFEKFLYLGEVLIRRTCLGREALKDLVTIAKQRWIIERLLA